MPPDIAFLKSPASAGAGPLARRRALGAYYTPPDAAHYMATWALRKDGDRVLEPSVGDGAFLDAVAEVSEIAGFEGIEITAVELDRDVSVRTLAKARPGVSVSPLVKDFLSVSPTPHEVVIGNPPYVRLRNLPAAQRSTALRTAENWLGTAMDPSGSTWMPFVVHATQCLRPGGRMALVLPYEVTYVRYARPLWEFLGARFGSLRLVRTLRRIFPDILQEVVLLFADEKGRSTGSVDFEAFESFDQLRDGVASSREQIAIREVVDGRPFVAALLPAALRELLDGRLATVTQPARDFAKFRIGYVAGDKAFFHPNQERLSSFGLTSESLRPALGSARKLKGQGLWTSRLGESATTHLFAPTPGELSEADKRYIAYGVETGVDDRYKCRIRDPWYVVPYVHTPDVVLTVFSEHPLLLANDGGLVASNSLLCGYSSDGDSGALARQWYTTLTLLYLELQVHALGGGVFVLVPRETGDVRIAKPEFVAGAHLDGVNEALLRGDVEAAYSAGDQAILVSEALTHDQLDLIRQGVAELRRWRQSARSPSGDE